jgi:gas vesicle protein
MTQGNDALKYIGVAVVAGAVGAALGMLFAPASGQETRRRIAQRIEEAGQTLRSRLHHAGESACEHLEGTVEHVEHAVEAGARKMAKTLHA